MLKNTKIPASISAKNGKWFMELNMNSLTEGTLVFRLKEINKDFYGIIKIIENYENNILVQYVNIFIDGLDFKYPQFGSDFFKTIPISSFAEDFSCIDIIYKT